MTVVVVIKFLEMKKIIWTIFAIAALIFSSCSNKVNLYSDEGDTTIVYAMLDTGADTNFFKITHSFVGNVNDLAQNYDANNYTYDELEVKFSGVFEGNPVTQTITLDTVSKWIPYDPNATFYNNCWQTYYYTTKKLIEGNEYTLTILRKADNVTISATTKTINTFAFKKPVVNTVGFTGQSASVEWRVRDASTMYHSTASYFEVYGYFHYSELMPGATDTVKRSIKWALGEGTESGLFTTANNDMYYAINYTPNALFDIISQDAYLNNNSPVGVKRWFDKFEFVIFAIGEDLYNYHLIANSNSAIQDVPNYTNVTNGNGIMSARVAKNKFVTIMENSRIKICEDNERFGFINDPNR